MRLPLLNDVQTSAKSFATVLATVEANYANPIDADKIIYEGAIPGMLHFLDADSYLMDPQGFAQFRESLQGRYYGVGIMIRQQGSQTIVQALFGSITLRPMRASGLVTSFCRSTARNAMAWA